MGTTTKTPDLRFGVYNSDNDYVLKWYTTEEQAAQAAQVESAGYPDEDIYIIQMIGRVITNPTVVKF